MLSVFKSKYPILEACMNKGSTLELAVAVHDAGGYPSLCSWTYNGNQNRLRADLEKFTQHTGSNNIHVSFELHEYPAHVIQQIVIDYKLPTMEIIYGDKNTTRPSLPEHELVDDIRNLLEPIKKTGTKVFKRIYDNVDQDFLTLHMLDGLCIKGSESAGFTGHVPVRELFVAQQKLTPTALLIPYGGVGTAQQVKDYVDLGAEIVAVGTVLALSTEGPLSDKTKSAILEKHSSDLTQFDHLVGNVERKQNALEFAAYQGPDDVNGTIGLVRGMQGKPTGHVYLGHAIDHVTEILSCKQIIHNLTTEIT